MNILYLAIFTLLSCFIAESKPRTKCETKKCETKKCGSKECNFDSDSNNSENCNPINLPNCDDFFDMDDCDFMSSCDDSSSEICKPSEPKRKPICPPTPCRPRNCANVCPPLVSETLKAVERDICSLVINFLGEIRKLSTDLVNSLILRMKSLAPDCINTGLTDIFAQMETDGVDISDSTKNQLTKTLDSGYNNIMKSVAEIFENELKPISSRLNCLGINEIRQYLNEDPISFAVKSATATTNFKVYSTLVDTFSEMKKIYTKALTPEEIATYEPNFNSLRDNIESCIMGAVIPYTADLPSLLTDMETKINDLADEKKAMYDEIIKNANDRLSNFIFGSDK